MNAEIIDCNNAATYQRWRQEKLHDHLDSPQPVSIVDPNNLQEAERREIKSAITRCNFAIFQAPPAAITADSILALGRQLGLEQNDHNLCAEDIGVSEIRVKNDAARRYIPYTNRALSWHTDGYYNPPGKQVYAWLLCCVRDAHSGGENALLDHQIAYMRLRDYDPRLIQALQHPRAMTIPANIENGKQIRAEQTGPVFSYNRDYRCLHMRYSARARNVVWRDDPETRDAVAFLNNLLDSDEQYLYRLKLEPGQGIVSNNVLHRREAFTDSPDQGRLLYRARYFNPITSIPELRQ